MPSHLPLFSAFTTSKTFLSASGLKQKLLQITSSGANTSLDCVIWFLWQQRLCCSTCSPGLLKMKSSELETVIMSSPKLEPEKTWIGKHLFCNQQQTAWQPLPWVRVCPMLQIAVRLLQKLEIKLQCLHEQPLQSSNLKDFSPDLSVSSFILPSLPHYSPLRSLTAHN